MRKNPTLSLLTLVVILCTLFLTTGISSCKDKPVPPVTGDLPLLVILWDPQRPEVTEKPTVAQVEELVFGNQPSVADFYAIESRGKVRFVKAGVFGYLADKPANHYWYHPAPGTPGGDEFNSGHVEKWAEAIRKADKEFNFAAYDKNGDKKLDPTELGILIVIPQNSPFGVVRPLAGAEYPKWKPLVVDGMTLTNVAEVYTGIGKETKNIPMNMGVANHELGHLFFKAVDMYHDGSPTRPGDYSIMDVSYTDAQFDPYHRVRTGWMKPTLVTGSGLFQLEPSLKNGEYLKIIRTNHSPSEYFIIENRQHGDYDSQLPDTGLALWRIIENETAPNWIHNIQLVRAPGPNSYLKALWHAPENTETELVWTDGTKSGIKLSQISPCAETMSLVIDLPGAPEEYLSAVEKEGKLMNLPNQTWPQCPAPIQ